MNMGNYAHGNQPIQHMIYLYNYSSQPWKAQYWLREVMERMYNANPDAIAVMRTTARHLLGTCFQLWDSIPLSGYRPVCAGCSSFPFCTSAFGKW